MASNVIDFTSRRMDREQAKKAVALSKKVTAIATDAVLGGLDPALVALTLFRDACAAADSNENPAAIYTVFRSRIEEKGV